MSSFAKDPLRIAERVDQIFGDDLHARRVLSLSNGVAGTVTGTVSAAVLSIHAIGRGYARFTNQLEKHGVKQSDRMLGNAGILVWDLLRPWIAFVVGERVEMVIALDWTEFDADNDNPFSEPGFKTVKHRPASPSASVASRMPVPCVDFFAWYDGEHYHSGIGLQTPNDVHYGRAQQRADDRAAVLVPAHLAHPERFVRGAPQAPRLPTAVWINKPLADQSEQIEINSLN